MDLAPGTRLGHYDVTVLIGEGGMGQVYRATDTELGRDVALKILPDAMWNALAQRYTQGQLVECVLIVGNYTQPSMFQNTLGARLPLMIEGRPDSAVTR
ncbi:MAG: hypothetical protein IH939_11795 [Acidobacteria bacterium]|nr:hypothetical protein [Acidobacteriota bacterium]